MQSKPSEAPSPPEQCCPPWSLPSAALGEAEGPRGRGRGRGRDLPSSGMTDPLRQESQATCSGITPGIETFRAVAARRRWDSSDLAGRGTHPHPQLALGSLQLLAPGPGKPSAQDSGSGGQSSPRSAVTWGLGVKK